MGSSNLKIYTPLVHETLVDAGIKLLSVSIKLYSVLIGSPVLFLRENRRMSRLVVPLSA